MGYLTRAECPHPAVAARGETPLLSARGLFFEGRDQNRAGRILRLLINAGARVDAQDDMGYSALITAAVNNKPRLARRMLGVGADPHTRTSDGMTALAWARDLGHREIESLLLAAGARK